MKSEHTDILFITDIPFWLKARGDQQPIDTLIRHCANRGYRCAVQMLRGYDEYHCPSLDWVPVYPTEIRGVGLMRMITRMLWQSSQSSRYPWKVRIFCNSAIEALARLFLARTGLGWNMWLRTQRSEYGDAYDILYKYASPTNAAAGLCALACLKPRIVVLQFLRMTYLTHWIDRLKRISRPFVILDTHDLYSEKGETYTKSGIASPLTIAMETEMQLASMADAILAIQTEEASTLERLMDAMQAKPTTTSVEQRKPVVTVPHSHPISVHATQRIVVGRILFVGVNIIPNLNGIEEFIRLGWPIVNAAEPSAHLRIVGTICKALESYSSSQNVELAGFVDRLDEEYERADIVIAPLWIGGGLKIKVVEALCNGRPLVTTRIGAQGLMDGANDAYVLADSAAEMGLRVVELLQNPDLKARYRRRATEYARRTFDEEPCFRDFDRLIEGVLEGHA